MRLPRALSVVLAVMLSLPIVLASLPAPAQIFWIEAPDCAPPSTGIPPEFGDLDGDGDSDLIYGVVLHSYRNVGTPFVPSWQRDDTLVAGVEYVNCMTTCLADLDADGDLDLSVGQLEGEVWSVLYYRNVGNSMQPIWQADNSMYETLPLYPLTHPELADLDGDDDLDLVVSSNAHFRAYRNTGTPVMPVWTADSSLIDGIAPAYWMADQNFGDVDADGDLDIVLGSREGDGPIMCFENTGTVHEPAWVENEDLLTGVDRLVATWGLDLADIDGDGDVDLVLFDESVGSVVYLNCGSVTSAEQPMTWGAIKAMFK
jgi:hypothetical protein